MCRAGWQPAADCQSASWGMSHGRSLNTRVTFLVRVCGATVFACLAAITAFAQAPQYTILPFAGAPPSIGDNGPATSALLNEPHGVSADRNGNLYIADTTNNLIRRVSSTGAISTLSNQVS